MNGHKVLIKLGGAVAAIIVVAVSLTVTKPTTKNPAATTPPGSGSEVTRHGTLACLPPRGNGPTTLECAIGLKADDGYYALTALAQADSMTPMNTPVTITGQLTSDTAKYAILGTIVVSKFERH